MGKERFDSLLTFISKGQSFFITTRLVRKEQKNCSFHLVFSFFLFLSQIYQKKRKELFFFKLFFKEHFFLSFSFSFWFLFYFSNCSFVPSSSFFLPISVAFFFLFPFFFFFPFQLPSSSSLIASHHIQESLW